MLTKVVGLGAVVIAALVIVTSGGTATEKRGIVVLKSGVASSRDLDAYGAILRNTSKNDATDIFIQGNVLDAHKTILSSTGPIIPLIPAGATYYWGGDMPHKAGTHPASFEVRITQADYVDRGGKLPRVSNVKLGSDGYNLLVDGKVTNTVGFTLSQIATINVVFQNKKGKVLGGASGLLDADLPKGRSALFEVTAFKIVPRSQIASFHVDVDAEHVP
jgi:hypothetical protein